MVPKAERNHWPEGRDGLRIGLLREDPCNRRWWKGETT